MLGTMSIAEQYKELLMVKRGMTPTLSQKMFVWGLLAMKIASWSAEAEEAFGMPQIVKYVMIVFALFSMIYMMYQRPITMKYYGPMGLFVVAFAVYGLWLAAATFEPTVRYLQFLLAAKYFVLPFVIPAFLLFTKFDLKFVSYMMRFSLKLLPLLFVVLLTVLVMLDREKYHEHLQRLHMFNFALPFVLLCIHYLNGKSRQRNMLIVLFIAMMAVGSIYGRRAYVIEIIMIFFFYYLIMSLNKTVSTTRKLRSYFTVGLALFVFILMLGTLKNNLYIFERGLNSEGWEESRGGVLREFFADFGSRPGDWLWGRGLEGRVLRSLDVEGGGYGDVIESGYLYILLKAGGLYLFLMMAILLTAAFRGWFRSRNQLAKAASAILVIHMIGMISFNLPVFSADYVLVWICVVLCFSKDILALTDQEVKILLNL